MTTFDHAREHDWALTILCLLVAGCFSPNYREASLDEQIDVSGFSAEETEQIAHAVEAWNRATCTGLSVGDSDAMTVVDYNVMNVASAPAPRRSGWLLP